MGLTDFPLLFAASGYGGLACSLLAAAGIALYALRRRRGTRRQFALSSLGCLVASGLMLAPLWWLQARLDTAGPTVGETEVALWLAWVGLVGYFVPLGSFASYIVLAAPNEALWESVWGRTFRRATDATDPADPVRLIEPLGEGQVWCQLVPLAGPTPGRPLPIGRAVALLGREIDNDIIIEDEDISRHHAEIRWNDGRPRLFDRGSMNGTQLNSQAVRGSTPLTSGDIVQVGTHRYRFERLEAAPPAALEPTRKVAGVQRDSSPKAAARERLTVVATNGQDTGARWDLTGALLMIGRDGDCAIRLADASVSRRHAQIVRQASGYFVSDLESSNGTLLNGRDLTEPALLRPGDVVRVGVVELRCESAATPVVVEAEASGVPVGRAGPTQPFAP